MEKQYKNYLVLKFIVQKLDLYKKNLTYSIDMWLRDSLIKFEPLTQFSAT